MIETLVSIGGKYVHGVLGINIDQNLVGVSTIDIRIPITSGLKKYDEIRVYEVTSSGDELVFIGYVSNLIIDLDTIQVQGRDLRDAFKYKILTIDTTYTDKTISYIVNDILSKWNSYTGESYTCECFVENTTTRELSKGDDIQGIIDDLCKEFALTWKVESGKIIISNLVGTDKTNSITLIYNPLENQTTNIQSIVREMNDEQFNIILGTNSSSKTLVEALGDYQPMCSWYILEHLQKRWGLFRCFLG